MDKNALSKRRAKMSPEYLGAHTAGYNEGFLAGVRSGLEAAKAVCAAAVDCALEDDGRELAEETLRQVSCIDPATVKGE